MTYEKTFNSALKKQKSDLRQSVVLFAGLFILVAVTFTPRFSLAATANSCSDLFTQLWVDSEQSPDLHTRDGYWSRAKAAVAVASTATLDSLFAKMSKQGLEDLFWRITTGGAKATLQEETMVRELRHMVEDLGENVFWNPVENRGEAVWKAVAKYDQSFFEKDNLAFIARSIDKSIGKTELEIVARALAEHLRNATYSNSKLSDRAVRFALPHYQQVQSILKANKHIRRRLQFIAAIEAPIDEAIRRYGMSGFTDNQRLELQQVKAASLHRLDRIRHGIQTLYGRDVSASRPFRTEEIRIRELAKRAQALSSQDSRSSLHAAGEMSMDVLDRLFKIPMGNKHDAHLQIRNEQFRRETKVRMDNYLDVTRGRSPENAEYEVRTDWMVTVRNEERRERKWTRDVPDSEGHVTRTETYQDNYTNRYDSKYPMYRQDTMRVTYEEILQNDVVPVEHLGKLPPLPQAQVRGEHAVSAANEKPFINSHDFRQTDIILGQAATVRQTERFFRTEIVRIISFINGITNEAYKETLAKRDAPTMLAKIENEERRLNTIRERLSQYQALDASAIKGQWASDVEKDFRDRNRALLEVYDHTAKRIAHLAEQVRRETPSLVVEVEVPTYEAQLELLKAVRDRNKHVIQDVAIGAGLTGAAAVTYQYHPEILDAIRSLSDEVRP